MTEATWGPQSTADAPTSDVWCTNGCSRPRTASYKGGFARSDSGDEGRHHRGSATSVRTAQVASVATPLRRGFQGLRTDSPRRPVAPQSPAVGSLVRHTAPRLTAPESGRFADRLMAAAPPLESTGTGLPEEGNAARPLLPCEGSNEPCTRFSISRAIRAWVRQSYRIAT